MIDFDFEFRPIRVIYILMLSVLCWFFGNIIAGLICLCALLDISLDIGAPDTDVESLGPKNE